MFDQSEKLIEKLIICIPKLGNWKEEKMYAKTESFSPRQNLSGHLLKYVLQYCVVVVYTCVMEKTCELVSRCCAGAMK